MEIGWILTIFFVFMTMIFVVIAFFFPEWVGITGKKAREFMDEQRGDSSSTDDSSKPKDQ